MATRRRMKVSLRMALHLVHAQLRNSLHNSGVRYPATDTAVLPRTETALEFHP